LCAKWIAGSMRPFQIVTDQGLKDLIQVCLDIGNFVLIYYYLKYIIILFRTRISSRNTCYG
jgi:hypothetical protein